MTGRPRLQAYLDAAVEQRTITLLQGLPRVGRSRLITDWLERRPDAAPCSDPAKLAGSNTIAVLDQLDQAKVPALVSAVRASEAAGERRHRVLVVATAQGAPVQRALLQRPQTTADMVIFGADAGIEARRSRRLFMLPIHRIRLHSALTIQQQFWNI